MVAPVATGARRHQNIRITSSNYNPKKEEKTEHSIPLRAHRSSQGLSLPLPRPIPLKPINTSKDLEHIHTLRCAKENTADDAPYHRTTHTIPPLPRPRRHMLSSPIVEPIVRDRPVDWLAIVSDALRSVGAPAMPVLAANTLASLSSYGATPLPGYADPSTGAQAVQVHVALLRALDASVSAWPSALRGRICAPPLPRLGDEGTAVEMAGVRPLAEAVLVLCNAAAVNLEAGAAALDRVRGDAARLNGPRATTSNTTTTNSAAPPPLRAPSVNAKAAYRHFTSAGELAAAALALLGGPTDYGAGLAALERRYLLSFVDPQGMGALAALCRAASKYVYSLFSAAGADSPNNLARLAFVVSALPVPTASSSAVQLLPSVMLAAYHRHRAEHYYGVGRGIPDMTHAVGHIELAGRILREIDARCGAEGSLEEEGGRAPDSSGGKEGGQRGSSPAAWGRRLWSTLQSLSPSPKKPARKEDSDSNDADDGESEGDAPATPSVLSGSFCSNLTRYTSGSGDGAELARLCPVLDHTIRRVVELSRQYRRENAVVYFARPAPPAAVQADAPDVTAEVEAATVTLTAAVLLPDPATVIDESAFDALPSPADLVLLQAAAHRRGGLDAAVQRVAAVAAALEGLRLPEEATLALEALRPCLEPHTGSVSNALAVAQGALQSAAARHVAAVERWSAAQGRLLGHSSSEDEEEGEDRVGVKPTSARTTRSIPAMTVSLESDVRCWDEAAADAADQWARAVGPFDVRATASVDAIRVALVPGEDAARVLAQRCAAAVQCATAEDDDDHGDSNGNSANRKRARLETSPRRTAPSSATTTSESLALLAELEREGAALLRRLEPLYGSEWWQGRLGALRAVALAIWDAPQIANRLEEGTARLEAEAAEATGTAAARAVVRRRAAGARLAAQAKVKARARATVAAAAAAAAAATESPASSEGFHTPAEVSGSDKEEDGEEEEAVAVATKPRKRAKFKPRRALAKGRKAANKAAKKVAVKIIKVMLSKAAQAKLIKKRKKK